MFRAPNGGMYSGNGKEEGISRPMSTSMPHLQLEAIVSTVED